MFRRWFGGAKDDDTPKAPEHAADLRVGDFLKLGLVAPDGLANAELQVAGVRCIDFGGPGKYRRVLDVEAPGLGMLRLWRDENDRVALGRSVDRPVVERLFDLDSFGKLFDPDEPPAVVLERQSLPDGMDGWVGALYRQENAQVAFRHNEDPAVDLVGGLLTGAGEEIDFYRLVSDDRRHAVEVQVHDGGHTDVILVALLPASLIEELWSG